MIFDTHTHLNVEEFSGREAEEIALAAEMGVTRMNIVGFDKPTIERALELVDKYDQSAISPAVFRPKWRLSRAASGRWGR